MREPRRFPRPRRHVTPSQKASSPKKLTRPIPQRSAPLHAARGRTIASTKQENMSRKNNATATATSHPRNRKTCRPSEKHTFAIPQRSAPPPRLAVERLRPQIRKTCREKPMQPHPQSRKTCRPSEKHTFAIPKGARRPAARGRTVASTNQENMSRKSPATATALTIVPVCC